jgi:hypothetical protein
VITFEWLRNVKGLKSLIIDWDRGRAKFEFSAKILGKDYFDLISKDNIEWVFETINRLGIGIEFYVDRVLEYGEIVNCDFTANLKVREPVRKYIFDLFLEASRLTSGWFVKRYRSNSVVFEEAKKTKPLRATFYNKYAEMLKRRDYDLGIEKFKNILRFEINAKRKKNVRDLAGIETNSIKDVLNSSANPFLMVFEKLFRGQISLLLKENVLESLKRGDKRKYFEVKGVLSEGMSLEEYRLDLMKGGYSESHARKIIRDLIRVLRIEPSRNERMRELYELLQEL